MSGPVTPTGSVVFTTRRGFADGTPAGVSKPPFDDFNLGAGVADDPAAVRANRAALAGRLGLAPDRLIWMGQVHGTAVAEVTAARADPVAATDGLVTATPGLGLAVLIADCVPVLAADRNAGVIGVAHAGRVGAAAGIATLLLDHMTRLGADPAGIDVVLGPAICGRCYEVPAGMRLEVEERLPGSASTTHAGTPGLDLRAGIRAQLEAAGVRRVDVDERCTREDPVLFSHRRSAPTGRFAGALRL